MHLLIENNNTHYAHRERERERERESNNRALIELNGKEFTKYLVIKWM